MLYSTVDTSTVMQVMRIEVEIFLDLSLNFSEMRLMTTPEPLREKDLTK